VDRRLDRGHHLRGRLQPGHLRISLGRRGRTLGDEVQQRAGLHALLTEARQDVGHIGQVRLMRADEQHPAAVMAEVGVGVEQVGGAVQRDDGLARPRPAVDDESAAGSRADDRVLISLDGAEHVAHAGGPVAAQTGDERRLVVQRRGVPRDPLGGEHLVPVVADAAAGPAVPPTARQTHRIAVRRAEERLGRRGTPVQQQPAPAAVREAEASDVDGLGIVDTHDVAEAEVQAEAAQRAQAGGEPVDLQVPVHRGLTLAARCLAFGVEARGQVGDGLREAGRDGREVLLVPGDERRVGLGGEVLGKVKCAGSQGVHVSSSDLRHVTLDRKSAVHEDGRTLL
jgi:hypothetical protein